MIRESAELRFEDFDDSDFEDGEQPVKPSSPENPETQHSQLKKEVESILINRIDRRNYKDIIKQTKKCTKNVLKNKWSLGNSQLFLQSAHQKV